jgi:hypothetical protein
VERLPVRYAALTCVIAGGLLISGPGLPASADPASGGTGNTTSGGDPASTNNGNTTSGGDPASTNIGATPRGLLSALSTLPGLNFLSQLPAGTGPTIGPLSPPGMNLSTSTAPATAPNAPKLVQAFMLPNTPGLGSAPQTPAARQLPAVVLPTQTAPAPQSQKQRQGANSLPTLPSTLPTITVVPPAPSGAPAAPPITINNSETRTPFNPTKPFLPQVLPPPLVFVLTVIANDIPLVGPVIKALMDATVPLFLGNLVSGIVVPMSSVGDGAPARMPSGLSPARRPVLSPSVPPPDDVAPMGVDVPEAPALGPTLEPPKPQTSQANGSSALSEPVAFRAGYSDYLRNAGMAEITAIAVPGAVAILLFSLCGGFIGYRQARAGHIIRAEGITRFLH